MIKNGVWTGQRAIFYSRISWSAPIFPDRKFGIEPADELLDAESVAQASTAVLRSTTTGEVVDVRKKVTDRWGRYLKILNRRRMKVFLRINHEQRSFLHSVLRS